MCKCVCVRLCVCSHGHVPVFEDGKVLLWLKVDLTLYHSYHCVEHLYICKLKQKKQQQIDLWSPESTNGIAGFDLLPSQKEGRRV